MKLHDFLNEYQIDRPGTILALYDELRKNSSFPLDKISDPAQQSALKEALKDVLGYASAHESVKPKFDNEIQKVMELLQVSNILLRKDEQYEIDLEELRKNKSFNFKKIEDDWRKPNVSNAAWVQISADIQRGITAEEYPYYFRTDKDESPKQFAIRVLGVDQSRDKTEALGNYKQMQVWQELNHDLNDVYKDLELHSSSTAHTTNIRNRHSSLEMRNVTFPSFIGPNQSKLPGMIVAYFEMITKGGMIPKKNIPVSNPTLKKIIERKCSLPSDPSGIPEFLETLREQALAEEKTITAKNLLKNKYKLITDEDKLNLLKKIVEKELELTHYIVASLVNLRKVINENEKAKNTYNKKVETYVNSLTLKSCISGYHLNENVFSKIILETAIEENLLNEDSVYNLITQTPQLLIDVLLQKAKEGKSQEAFRNVDQQISALLLKARGSGTYSGFRTAVSKLSVEDKEVLGSSLYVSRLLKIEEIVRLYANPDTRSEAIKKLEGILEKETGKSLASVTSYDLAFILDYYQIQDSIAKKTFADDIPKITHLIGVPARLQAQLQARLPETTEQRSGLINFAAEHGQTPQAAIFDYINYRLEDKEINQSAPEVFDDIWNELQELATGTPEEIEQLKEVFNQFKYSYVNKKYAPAVLPSAEESLKWKVSFDPAPLIKFRLEDQPFSKSYYPKELKKEFNNYPLLEGEPKKELLRRMAYDIGRLSSSIKEFNGVSYRVYNLFLGKKKEPFKALQRLAPKDETDGEQKTVEDTTREQQQWEAYLINEWNSSLKKAGIEDKNLKAIVESFSFQPGGEQIDIHMEPWNLIFARLSALFDSTLRVAEGEHLVYIDTTEDNKGIVYNIKFKDDELGHSLSSKVTISQTDDTEQPLKIRFSDYEFEGSSDNLQYYFPHIYNRHVLNQEMAEVDKDTTLDQNRKEAIKYALFVSAEKLADPLPTTVFKTSVQELRNTLVLAANSKSVEQLEKLAFDEATLYFQNYVKDIIYSIVDPEKAKIETFIENQLEGFCEEAKTQIKDLLKP